MYLFRPYFRAGPGVFPEMAYMDLRVSMAWWAWKLAEAASADGFERQLGCLVEGEKDPDLGERE